MKTAISCAVLLVGLFAAGCDDGAREAATPAATPAAGAVKVPEKLRPLGNGFPQPGSPCRRLGESAATSNYLDHTRILVGCPGNRNSAVVHSVIALGGHILTEIDGVVLLSVPVAAAPGPN